MNNLFRSIFVLFAFMCASQGVAGSTPQTPQDYKLGVYYFPGWKNDSEGLQSNKPWEKIKPFPGREPMLGWYEEGKVDVAEQQLQWMQSYGIDFVIYDWYWSANNRPLLEHAVSAYLQAPSRSKVQFSVLWANHSLVPTSLSQFEQIVRYWVKNYFSHQEYVTEDGKPVVYIFSPDQLEINANKFGMTTQDLLGAARQIAKSSGLQGIYFVGNSATGWGSRGPAKRGYDALTGYVYRNGFSGQKEPRPENYTQMDASYRRTWQWILEHLDIPYFPPVVFGWNHTPWGITESGDDCCVSTPETFRQHLQAARKMVDAYPDKTKKTVVICCWNEYGEGNYIEPTKKNGFEFLEQINAVFGK